MFSDPQSVSVSGSAKSLPRVSVGANTASYKSADGNLTYTISHSYGKRVRRNVRLDFRKVAADPLLDGVSRPYSMFAYIVVDHPDIGFSNAEMEANTKALIDELAEAGNLTKIFGGES
jgi:hypothetical protein